MADRDKELKLRLSMLLDGELDGRDNPRLIERIEHDEDLKQTWARYNLIGQAMRSPRGLMVDDEFARRISSAIEKEPTVLAPRRGIGSSSERRQRVVGFALAASLAGVALMVGKSVVDHGGELVANLGSGQAVAMAPANEKVAEAQFNDYLLSHNETAYLAGSAGMLPYVRSVSYIAENH
jgi:sigma-E factor negative regulatory protein RseA